MIPTLVEQKLIYESIIYHDGRTIGKMLMEKELTADDITDIFNQLGQRLSTEKANKTVIGKGADKVSNIVSSMTKQWEKVKDSISSTGPVRGFDAAFQSLKDTIRTASGPSGKITKAIEKYREWAKHNPKTQGAILAGLTAIAGMATGGAGLPYIVGGFRTFDRLLKGDKLSHALMSGGLAGGLAYGGQQLYKHSGDLLHSHNDTPSVSTTPEVDSTEVSAPSSSDFRNVGNASQFNDVYPTNGTSPSPTSITPPPEHNLVDPVEYTGKNPPAGVPMTGTPTHNVSIYNPPNGTSMPGTPSSGSNPDNYVFHKHIPTPNVHSVPRNSFIPFDPYAYNVGRNYGYKVGNSVGNTIFNSAINFSKGIQLTEWVNLPATLFSWQLAESLNKPYGHSVLLTESGRKEIFRRIDEGFWDTIKTAFQKGWNSAKHKLTADDIELKWRRYAKENGIDTAKSIDSDKIKKFLENLLGDKFKDPSILKLVDDIFNSMGILTTAPTTASTALPPDEELVRDLLYYVNNHTPHLRLRNLIKRIAVANGIMKP
jgi:hypothetical protein